MKENHTINLTFESNWTNILQPVQANTSWGNLHPIFWLSLNPREIGIKPYTPNQLIDAHYDIDVKR